MRAGICAGDAVLAGHGNITDTIASRTGLSRCGQGRVFLVVRFAPEYFIAEVCQLGWTRASVFALPGSKPLFDSGLAHAAALLDRLAMAV
jgi:hypothetical protein